MTNKTNKLFSSTLTALGYLCAGTPSYLVAEETEVTEQQIEPVVISATRSATPVSEVSRSVTVLTEEQIREQASLDNNLSSILAKTVPGIGPSTEAVSNFGQSLRGRNFLVLIDGIPQSTPLRDGFRDLNTIDPSVIERIEVVRGGTAVYGFGAAGGLVNIITKEPSKEALAAYSDFGLSFSTEEFDDSGEYKTTQRISGTKGNFDYLASGSFIDRNSRFDSEGRRIPPDPLGAQGGFSDTQQYNVLGKLGYNFDSGNQRLDFSINHFDVEQDTNFIFGSTFSLGSDPLPDSRRTPAVRRSEALPGSDNIEDPGTENTIANITYTNNDLFGSSVNINTYYGDQTAVFSRFTGFPQSEIESEKFGNRLTIDTPLKVSDIEANVIWGLDFNHDETSQETFGPEATSDPLDLEQDAIAGFAELEIPVGSYGLLRGGVRHEDISVEVDTVPQNRFGNTVLGGELNFSETLFNASAVYFLTDSMELFGSFSQGFSISDIGRVIDDAGSFGAGETFRANQFESEAEKVDNYEIGLRGIFQSLQFTIAGFYSDSDNGTSFDEDLNIQRFSEEIWGVEASLDYQFNDQWTMGGTFSLSEGERDSQTGEEDLPNTRVQPEKLTAYLGYAPRNWWQNRLQVEYVGDRNPDSTAFGSGNVNNYTLVDLISNVAVGPGQLRLTVENLLNKDYFPAINQAFDSDFAFAKGPGRRIGVGYSINW